MLAMTADNIEHVISYWVIFQKFHSPTLGGFAVISHWMPFLLFSVYMGALADRYDCRRLIQAGQALFMLASILWGVLFLTDTLRVWHAVVILLVHGVAGVVGTSAVQLILHDMVGPEHLHSAIRLNASSRNLAILFGPAVGGGLLLLLGPAWGILANVLMYFPLTIFLIRVPYTGHGRRTEQPRRARFGLAEALHIFAEARSDRRITRMIVLGGATSFLVGNAFQALMPEYAHDLGTDEAGVRYSMLLAANAAGAVLGALLLESTNLLHPTARAAIVCAGLWGVTMVLFPAATSHPAAIMILVVAGVLNIAFTSMAQTIVQVLAPPQVRGSIVGLFNTAILGLRAGSGLTVGVLGALIGIHWSLALSAGAVVVTAGILLTAQPQKSLTTLSQPPRDP
ncbi:MAG: MFS transporter [Candidatus Rokuibacteriota bacterium]|nr:MAG: MFS transporter [Candidatus Rokubacteria bacterium]